MATTSSQANLAARQHRQNNQLPAAQPVSLVAFGLLDPDSGTVAASVNSSGELVTNTPLADAYFAEVTVSTAQKERINRFIRAITDAGLLDGLVDAAFLREGQNTGTGSPRTLRLATGTMDNSPTWGPHGVFFNGSNQRAKFTVTSTKPFTLVSDQEIPATGGAANAWMGGLINSAGSDTAAQGVQIFTSNAATAYCKQGGTTTLSDSWGDTGDARTVHRYNPTPQIIGLDYDDAGSPTVHGYTNGSLVMTDSTSLTRSTSNLDTVTFGAVYTSGTSWTYHVPVRVASWALFNRVLTAGEHLLVAQALRHLDGRAINFVVTGDSIAAQICDSTRGLNTWPFQLMRTPQWAGRARLYNTAINGSVTSGIAANFTTMGVPWAANGSSVTETVLLAYGGTAGIILGDSAATAWANMQSVYAQAKAVGMRVVAFTLPASKTNVGVGYTTATEAIRVAYNTLVRDGSAYYDALVDLDAMCPYHADLFIDELHPNAAGNLALAEFIASGNSRKVFDNWPENIATGTTGAATINRRNGSVNFAAAATSLVVTNSLVTATSTIMLSIGTNDATMTSAQAVAGTGSFTIYANAAATAETRVHFRVMP